MIGDGGQLLGVQHQPRAIAKLAYDAGWKDAELLVTAVAVCLAESQGYDRAINENPDGTTDRGMWQLNSIHAGITDAIAYDPLLSSSAAFTLYQAAGWDSWVAHKSGVYLHDTYVGRASFGTMNYLASVLGAAALTSGYSSQFHLPLVSLKTLRNLYPSVLGL